MMSWAMIEKTVTARGSFGSLRIVRITWGQSQDADEFFVNMKWKVEDSHTNKSSKKYDYSPSLLHVRRQAHVCNRGTVLDTCMWLQISMAPFLSGPYFAKLWALTGLTWPKHSGPLPLTSSSQSHASLFCVWEFLRDPLWCSCLYNQVRGVNT